MNIGIIGSGAAGLTSAWLLGDRHKVTVFEKQARLGGHAHTVEVDIGGRLIPIDAGLDFFTRGMWPTFYRLLEILRVPLRRYQITATFYTTDNRRLYPMPFMRDGKVNWSLLRPAALSTMLEFRRVLQCAKPLVEAADTSMTLEEFTESLKLSRRFKDEFFYPLLLATWCVEMEDLKQFAAYNALKYVVMRETEGLSQFSTEVVGGMRAYIQTLVKALSDVRIESDTQIKRMTRPAGRYLVEDGHGRMHEFDHLIVATNAHQARDLIAQLEGTEDVRRVLSRFEYFKGTIAVHGDRRLMPASEKHWSVLNIRHDGVHSALTVSKRWKSVKTSPVFKSWVTYEPRLPEPLYFLATYDHARVSPNHFQAQKALAPLQGQNNLWLAGLYTHDIDCHESAIVSAVNIAQRLDPQSPNLKHLTGTRGN
jgi:predicted NAD/FAD-binding protein